jgi:hypothetical protein
MKFFPWLALTYFAGCSSPYQFSSEIGSFSTGVDNVSSSYTIGYSNLANDRLTYKTLVLEDTSAKLTLTNGCNPATPSNLPCDFYRQRESPPTPSPAEILLESSRQKTLEALKVLTDYAHALQAVTNAADRAAFDSAASRLNASVTALLKGVPNPAVAPAFSAGFSIFAWMVGQALDQQRFDTLKQSVNLAAGPDQLVAPGQWLCPDHSFCPYDRWQRG